MRFSVDGYITVTKRPDDGPAEVLVNRKHNQLTYAMLDRMIQLLLQRSSDLAPGYNQLGSMWFESATLSLSTPQPDDEGPDALSTVVGQKAIAEVNKTDDEDVLSRSLIVSTTLEKADANGADIAALGLYSKGSTGLIPSAVGFTAGTDDVYCLARQKVGPFAKASTYALDFAWEIVITITVDA